MIEDFDAKILSTLVRLEALGKVTHEDVKLVRKDIKEHGKRLGSLERTRAWQKGAARVGTVAGICITAIAGWFFKP